MKTLLFILISFNCFSQDTIQPPCDLTRQQTRLWHDLQKTNIKLYYKQQERETEKEVKALKWAIKSERIEKRKQKDEFDFKSDSIKRSYNLQLEAERNRFKERERELRNEKKEADNQTKLAKQDKKIAKAEARKATNWNIALICFSILSLASLFFVYKMK